MDPELKILDESVSVAVHGLKNELTRLHQLYKDMLEKKAQTGARGFTLQYDGTSPAIVWERIIVVQEALLNLARAYSAKLKKETGK